MPPTYFVDENMLAVGRALAAVRDDVLHPGHPKLPEVPLGAQDPEWLPIVGRESKDLIVITRDRRIRTKPAERELFDANGVRAIFLTGSNDMTKWNKFVMLVRMWDRIEKEVGRAGPGPWSMGLVNSNIKML